MLSRRQVYRLAVLVSLAVSLLLASPSRLSGDVQGSPEDAGRTPRSEAMAATWQLIAACERGQIDTIGLAGQVLDLSAAQDARVQELVVEHENDKARALAQLSDTYADRVREELGAEQRERYDGALEALKGLAGATAAARQEFREAAGTDAAAAGPAPDLLLAGDLSRLLDLDEPKREQLRQLRRGLHASLGDALQNGLDRGKWQDPEAWREHTRKYRQRVKDVRAEFERKRKEILSDDQIEKLEKMEAAAERYRRKVQEARREAYKRLHGLLKGQEEVAGPSEPAGPEPPGAPDP